MKQSLPLVAVVLLCVSTAIQAADWNCRRLRSGFGCHTFRHYTIEALCA